jgi:hypothetical protein
MVKNSFRKQHQIKRKKDIKNKFQKPTDAHLKPINEVKSIEDHIERIKQCKKYNKSLEYLSTYGETGWKFNVFIFKLNSLEKPSIVYFEKHFNKRHFQQRLFRVV